MPLGHAGTAHRLAPRIRYRCGSCSKLHAGFPELAFAAPDAYVELAEADRTRRARLGEDFCVVDERFFIRSTLDLAVAGTLDHFVLSVWAEVAMADFQVYFHSFHEPANSRLGVFAGRLANALPGLEHTSGLACRVMPRDRHERPLVAVSRHAHDLGAALADGLALDRAIGMVQASRIGAMVVLG
jgi:hypothetical protein